LTDVLRNGARGLLAQAIEAEVAAALAFFCLLPRKSCKKEYTIAST
jgi:hypothetical protein